MREWTDEAYARVLAHVRESIRLRGLTPAALVRECVSRGDVDDPLIEEICTRLDPRWAYRDDPEAEWPGREQM